MDGWMDSLGTLEFFLNTNERSSLAGVIMAQACLSFVLDSCPEVFPTQPNISLHIINLNLLCKTLIISHYTVKHPWVPQSQKYPKTLIRCLLAKKKKKEKTLFISEPNISAMCSFCLPGSLKKYMKCINLLPAVFSNCAGPHTPTSFPSTESVISLNAF